MPKLINSPDTAVVDCLDGLLLSCPLLNRLDGFPGVKVIVHENQDPNRVAVISGGGAGHEPMHAGFVGPGMLAAAVCGEVFASPSVEAVLAAIHAVSGLAGCLLVVKNYTGDRLNFGIAAEKAKADGIPVQVVIVQEDCAVATPGIAGPRGLAGTILVHKIAGAASASGLPLSRVAELATLTTSRMATVGTALSTCTLPGQPKADRVASGTMEVGLGIHGEPGAHTCPLGTATETVAQMLQIIAEPPTGRISVLTQGHPVALLVNSLGTTPPMEVAIVAKEAVNQLREKYKVAVVRCYSGALCTSLDMAGVSLTVLDVNGIEGHELLALLDFPTQAPAWPNGPHQVTPKAPWQVPPAVKSAFAPLQPQNPPKTAYGAAAGAAIKAAAEALVAKSKQLDEWDAKVGDGDCGSTLALGAKSVLADLDKGLYPLDSPEGTLRALAHSCRAMGGTSGALYEILFTAAAGSLADAEVDAPDSLTAWTSAAEAGLAAVQHYGGARRNSRTMLDALLPAADALAEAAALDAEQAVPLLKACTSAADAAEKGAEATKGMSAAAGRSSYVPEKLLKEVADPGAAGAAIWIRALVNALNAQQAAPKN